jgi:5-methylcytosine-specific restriction endonuclease McrA
MRGRRLQRTRALLFEQQPFCVMCGERLATVRDHIVPFGAGGADTDANTRALCTRCHDIRHHREAR